MNGQDTTRAVDKNMLTRLLMLYLWKTSALSYSILLVITR